MDSRRQARHLRSRIAPNAGHTLVEMLVVVVVLSITTAIALPRLDYVALRLDANSRVVRSTMQQAWRLSIQSQHDVLVSFDTANRRMRTLEDLNGDNMPTSGERQSWRSLEEGARFSVPPTGLSGLVTTPIVGPGIKTVSGMPTIIFRRNGSTSGDVQVYFGATSRYKQQWRAVSIVQSTGRTEWFRYVTPGWRSGGI